MKRYFDRTQPGMKQATMLYKSPGKTVHKTGTFDYIVVDKCDEEAFEFAIEDGWFESLPEAISGKPKKVQSVEMPKVPVVPEIESKKNMTASEVIAESKNKKAGK